jgi:hypothetical protein
MEKKKEVNEAEVQRMKEYLKNNSPFVSNNISHEEFVNGIKSGDLKITFNFEDIDATALCTGKKKTILSIIHILGLFLPPAFIIIFSIINLNWWLLIAIPIWYVATIITIKSGYKFSIYILLLTIGGWFARGFHFQDYFTFFPLTFIISQLLAEIEKEYDFMFITDVLVDSSRLFYVYKDKITILRNKNLPTV